MKSITETIKSLISSHGEEILQQPQRLKAMLADLLPNEKRMRYLVDLSLQADIPKKLRAIQHETSSVWDAKINALKHYFKEEYFLEDKPIKLIFDCWVEVLPIIINTEIGFENYKVGNIIETNPRANVENDTVTDIDGNVYKTVRIGNQVWMAENLKVSRYRDGDIIPNVKDGDEWKSLNTGAWCNYANNILNDSEYGKLYNRNAVTDYRKIAPVGWHISTDEEWTILIDFLGGKEIAAAKLKETGIDHWNSSNVGVTNESGFTALPGGTNIIPESVFGNVGIWWCSDCFSTRKIMSKPTNVVKTKINGLSHYDYWKGYSIRCVKDDEILSVIDYEIEKNSKYPEIKLEHEKKTLTPPKFILSSESNNLRLQNYSNIISPFDKLKK